MSKSTVRYHATLFQGLVEIYEVIYPLMKGFRNLDGITMPSLFPSSILLYQNHREYPLCPCSKNCLLILFILIIPHFTQILRNLPKLSYVVCPISKVQGPELLTKDILCFRATILFCVMILFPS